MKSIVAASLAVVVALAALLGAAGTATAQNGPAIRIEVRVWQNVGNERDIRISARPADGSWRTLGTIRLYLNDGLSSDGHYRYGDIALDVPLANWTTPATVEVRIWQSVRYPTRIYISARPKGGDWDALGTVRLPLADGLSSDGRFRYGDISLDVPLPVGGVSTLAGSAGIHGYKDGHGEAARFGWFPEAVMGLAVDRDGSVVVADFRNEAIRRILPDGTVTTIAGGNGSGSRDGPAETAQFEGPTDVAIDPTGAIYVADCWDHRIRKISPDGMVTTIAGKAHPPGTTWTTPRDGPADEAVFVGPCRIAIDQDGDLYITEQTRIRRLSPSGWVSTFAGGRGLVYRDGPRASAQFGALQDIALDGEGNVYVIDINRDVPGVIGVHTAVRKIDTSGQVSTLFRSRPPQEGGILAHARALAVTAEGTIYVSNTGRNQIVRVDGRYRLAVVAGTGNDGYGDGSLDGAVFSQPGAIDFLPDGSLVVADQGDSVIRIVSPAAEGRFTGVKPEELPKIPRLEGVEVTRFAGSPGHGEFRVLRLADGPGSQALFNRPMGMDMDALGNVLVADQWNNAIRSIAPDGTVTTIAGGKGEGARDGPSDVAQFSSPWDVAVGPDGSLYVADHYNGRVRKIAADGTVSTVGEAVWGTLDHPRSVAFDQSGNLLVAERGRLLRLAPDGTVSTVVNLPEGLIFGLDVDAEGTPVFAYADMSAGSIWSIGGDAVPFTIFEDAQGIYGGVFSNFLSGLALAADGTIYVTDWQHGWVVRIAPDGEPAIVVDRDGLGGSGNTPAGILLTPDGDLLVTDVSRHVIWKITLPDEADE